jgi:hypothetical protein
MCSLHICDSPHFRSGRVETSAWTSGRDVASGCLRGSGTLSTAPGSLPTALSGRVVSANLVSAIAYFTNSHESDPFWGKIVFYTQDKAERGKIYRAPKWAFVTSYEQYLSSRCK